MSKIRIYNLRIVPPEPVYTEVTHLKMQFEAVFGKQTLSRSKPHITIAAFLMDVDYQDFLLKALDQLSSVKKFKLAIQDFDIFENKSDVLVLKVLETKEMERIRTLVKILWIRDLHRKYKSLKMFDTPHITISKTNGKNMLYESLAFFQKIGYSKQIAIDHLTLVSRDTYTTWDWKHQIRLSS